MNAFDARTEMFAVFKATWDTTDYPDNVVYPDVANKTIPARQPYARLTVRHASGGQASLAGGSGEKKWRAEGTLWVQCFAPVGDGMRTAYSLGAKVLTAYRKARGTVWYRNQRLVEVGNNGGFEQVNVLVDFNYDHVE